MKRANNQVKIISRYVLLVTLAALVGINVYALNASRLAGNQVPMPFGVGASVVLSGSMEPELSVGDLLLCGSRRVIPKEILSFTKAAPCQWFTVSCLCAEKR